MGLLGAVGLIKRKKAMKTTMQEVYENFNTMSDADFKSWMLNTNLLEEEKRLSIRFAEFWAAEHDHPESYYLNAEEAYNDKYESDEEKLK